MRDGLAYLKIELAKSKNIIIISRVYVSAFLKSCEVSSSVSNRYTGKVG